METGLILLYPWPMRQWRRRLVGECRSKWAASLSPWKWCHMWDFKNPGNRDNNGKTETLNREPISSLPRALLRFTSSGCSLLTVHTFKWANHKWVYTQTQYCILWGVRGWTDDSVHNTTSSTHRMLTGNTTLNWFHDLDSFRFRICMTGITALKCIATQNLSKHSFKRLSFKLRVTTADKKESQLSS